MIVIFYIATFVLMVPASAYTVFGLYIPWIILAVGNVVFIIYDYALTGLTNNMTDIGARLSKRLLSNYS